MSLISALKEIVAAIPGEVEQLIEEVFDDTWTAAKPILAAGISAAEADVVANASNPAQLMTVALGVATGSLPALEAAGITAVGTTILQWVATLLAGHPAVVAAKAAT